MTAAPGVNGGAPHVHLRQGTRHTFRNEGEADARFIAEFRPALRIEEFFANLHLGALGRLRARVVEVRPLPSSSSGRARR